jgi:hypothetical protein
MDYHVLRELVLPPWIEHAPIVNYAAGLNFAHASFAQSWLNILGRDSPTSWYQLWAITTHERTRLRCILDAYMAHAFGINQAEFGWILKECDHPVTSVMKDTFTSRLDPKGFWRVDKEREPELRHTVLAQVAFADLQAQGLDAFLAGPHGDGWQLPETLRLADYALGHDDRAREPQPVAARLGPRFLPWQLEKDAATSWAECEAHATLLDQLWRHARSLSGAPEAQSSTGDASAAPAPAEPTKSASKKKPSGDSSQLSLI